MTSCLDQPERLILLRVATTAVVSTPEKLREFAKKVQKNSHLHFVLARLVMDPKLFSWYISKHYTVIFLPILIVYESEPIQQRITNGESRLATKKRHFFLWLSCRDLLHGDS